jgi:phospholipase C
MHSIEHVVVLMMENRSFDCLLGKLYPKSDAFDGLEGTESNPWHKKDGTVEQIRVWNCGVVTEEAACMPDPEPGELFEDVNVQLFGLDSDPGGNRGALMSGFVDNYARQPWPWTPEDPSGIMHYFLPSQVPIISRLALGSASRIAGTPRPRARPGRTVISRIAGPPAASSTIR